MKTIKEDQAVAIEKLRVLIGNVPVCMFTTLDNNGIVTSRPMTTVTIDDEGDFWFFTNEFGEKILDESSDNTIYLLYSHPGNNTYVYIKGTSHIVIDRVKIVELWRPMLKAWFPLGVDDPKLCLIRVITEEAKFWNSTANKMIELFNMVKAMAKKEPYKEGEVGTLHLG